MPHGAKIGTVLSYKHIVFYALSVILVALYFFWIWHYALQLPGMEDIHSSFYQILRFLDAEGILNKYQVFTEKHADHRLISSRILSLLSLFIFGYFNIKFLYLIGAFLVVLLVWIVYSEQFKNSVKDPYFLCIYVLLMLTPAFRTGTYSVWGISNFASITLAMLAILCMVKRGWIYFICFQVLGYFVINTQGNGILLLLIGGVFYFYSKNTKRYFYAHLGVSAFIMLIYLLGHSNNQEWIQGMLERAQAAPVKELLFAVGAFVTWLGQWVILREDIMHLYPLVGVLVSMAVGCVFLGSILLVAWKSGKYLFCEHPALAYMALYVFLTILGAAFERALIWSYYSGSHSLVNLWFVLDSRYSFYVLCLVVLMISIVFVVYENDGEQLQLRWSYSRSIYCGLLMLGLLFWGGRYIAAIPNMEIEMQNQKRCLRLWEKKHEAKPCLWHGETGALMQALEERGWLRFSAL